ncbi:MAG TPA: hypothetical protein VNP04_20465 [Alphaproteobacteria bacterium]|nr:hypothetical protein [Alphaproteobacteria bacterium]
MKKRWRSFAVSAVLALCVGFAAPAAAIELADPMAEYYGQHVIPFYRIDGSWISVLVLADTSFQRGSDIRMWFYNQACNAVRDDREALTPNDVDLLTLNDPRFAGIPQQGVILLDSCDLRANAGCAATGPGSFPFLAYILLFNTSDNRLIRLDSIPFNWAQNLWLRYNSYNTVAATIMDEGAFETWLTFFSASGDLERDMRLYGPPLDGDWANRIQLDAYDDAEKFLGSFRQTLLCFTRLQLHTLIPQLADKVGHILTFSERTAPVVGPRLSYSGFQETVLGNGVKFIATGYLHHSSERALLLPKPFRTLGQ